MSHNKIVIAALVIAVCVAVNEGMESVFLFQINNQVD